MTNNNQKKQNEGKGGFNPVIAAVTGAVVGAGVAIAGAVAMKDKKNREKVKEVLGDVKEKALDYKEQVEEKITNATKGGK